MGGIILEGKIVAERILYEAESRAQKFFIEFGRKPNLTVIMAGEDPSSFIYVNSKHRACQRIGVESNIIRLSADASFKTLAEIIADLNRNPSIDAILIQLPLPSHFAAQSLIDLVNPDKDADGFTSTNTGRLWNGDHFVTPCTPAGIIALFDHYNISVAGKNVVIAGRSQIVGKPAAALLLQKHATVTICHSRTCNLESITQNADILVAAIGKPAYFNRNYFKSGAILIDVGINRIPLTDVDPRWNKAAPALPSAKPKDYFIVGDIDPADMIELSSYYTPVPGGVGQMTVAMLMKNTVDLAFRRQNHQS